MGRKIDSRQSQSSVQMFYPSGTSGKIDFSWYQSFQNEKLTFWQYIHLVSKLALYSCLLNWAENVNVVKYVAFKANVFIRKRICRQKFTYFDLHCGVRTIFHNIYFTINSFKNSTNSLCTAFIWSARVFRKILDVFRTKFNRV